MDSLQGLGDRRAPALHRTLPTWAREKKVGAVEWRIFVPHQPGVAIFRRIVLDVGTSRSSAAAEIRRHRREMWARKQIIGTDVADNRIDVPVREWGEPYLPRQEALF